MTDKATARPWKAYHESGSMGSGGHWGIESMSSDPLFQRTIAKMVQNNHLSGTEASANARLIVKAVNAHEELAFALGCLSTAVLRYERGLEGGLSEAVKLADKARALLARIEGE